MSSSLDGKRLIDLLYRLAKEEADAEIDEYRLCGLSSALPRLTGTERILHLIWLVQITEYKEAGLYMESHQLFPFRDKDPAHEEVVWRIKKLARR